MNKMAMKHVNNIFNSGCELEANSDPYFKMPIWAAIEPTNICNLKCPSCSRQEFVHNKDNGRIGTLHKNHLKLILKQLPFLKEVKFHGLGEPFLAPNFDSLLKTLKNTIKNVHVVTTTNAAWSISARTESILKNIDHLFISLDGHDRESFESNRFPAKFENVIKNITGIMKLKPPNTKISINCCFSANSYMHLDSMVLLAKAVGINSIRFNLIQNWISSFNEGGKTRAKYEQLRRKHLSIVNIESLLRHVNQMYDIASCLSVDAHVVGNPEFDISKCKWGREMVYLTCNGDLLPCSMRCAPYYSFGNVFEQPIINILTSEKMSEFIQQKNNENPPNICKDCPYLLNRPILQEILINTNQRLKNDFLYHS